MLRRKRPIIWQDAKHLFEVGHYAHAMTAFEFVLEISELGKKDENFREISGLREGMLLCTPVFNFKRNRTFSSFQGMTHSK
jgi:hypothetical protein